jgi:hypothetical protein
MPKSSSADGTSPRRSERIPKLPGVGHTALLLRRVPAIASMKPVLPHVRQVSGESFAKYWRRRGAALRGIAGPDGRSLTISTRRKTPPSRRVIGFDRTAKAAQGSSQPGPEMSCIYDLLTSSPAVDRPHCVLDRVVAQHPAGTRDDFACRLGADRRARLALRPACGPTTSTTPGRTPADV